MRLSGRGDRPAGSIVPVSFPGLVCHLWCDIGLARAGLTTLGADLFSMGVAGAFAGFAAFWLARRLGSPLAAAAFAAGLLADWATYAVTSAELAAVHLPPRSASTNALVAGCATLALARSGLERTGLAAGFTGCWRSADVVAFSRFSSGWRRRLAG